MAAYLDAIGIDAGFCGLRALHTKRAIGRSGTVLGAGGGGVWYYNQYPDAITAPQPKRWLGVQC